MTVTVAVACYNHAPYVEECILSIAQQCDVDMELCWIDDRSSDKSFDVAKSILTDQSMKGRFKDIVIRENSLNRGAAYSLNLAARLGTGSKISFMNSDDFYAPNRLRTLSDLMDAENTDLAFSNIMPIDENGSSMIHTELGERLAFDAELLISRFRSVSAALLNRQIASSTGNFVVSRNLFELIGGFEDLKYCHDWLFILLSTLQCEPAFAPERLYNYRIHASNSFKSLSQVADKETDYVIRTYFQQMALKKPENLLVQCPQGNPAAFWSLTDTVGVRAFAERTFFPYSRGSRLLAMQ